MRRLHETGGTDWFTRALGSDESIQRNLFRVERWAHKNLTKFNRKSAKSYTGGGTTPGTRLGTAQLESKKKLAVLVDTKLNVNHQCGFLAKKANSILGCFRQNITNRSREVILLLCSTLVRLQLEHCVLSPSSTGYTGKSPMEGYQDGKGHFQS